MDYGKFTAAWFPRKSSNSLCKKNKFKTTSQVHVSSKTFDYDLKND